MAERIVLLAQGLALRVSAADQSWLARIELETASADLAPSGTLLLVGTTQRQAQSRALDPGTFWAELQWSSATFARFDLPGGHGTLTLEGSGLAATAWLEAGHELHALASALRLLLTVVLSQRGGLLVHCSSAVTDGRAVLFLGASEAGKTTTARRVGREGALRLADDTALLWPTEGAARIEPNRFDKASRLPGRVGSWPVHCAYVVRKGASETRCGAYTQGVFAVWSASIFMPRPSSLVAEELLERLTMLARAVPVRTLEAAASGPLLPAIDSDLALHLPQRPPS